MEQTTTQDAIIPLDLSEEEADRVIQHVNTMWDKGIEARKTYKDDWTACDRAYRCELEPINSDILESGFSQKCLPWAFEAAESWFSHIYSTTYPRDDQVFSLTGRTDEDEEPAEALEKFMMYKLDQMRFGRSYADALRQLVRRNHTVLKAYWKRTERVSYEGVQEEGRNLYESNVKTTYNGLAIDVIDLDDFAFYPIYGDFDKTTRIHQFRRHLDELQAAAQDAGYFNLHEIEEKECEPQAKVAIEDRDAALKAKGLRVREAWIHRIKINDRIFRNVVATVVNEKYLIRFQPNTYPGGASPFVFMALRPDGDCLYGYGLNSRGLPVLAAANEIFNSRLDEIRIRIHPPTKYYDDGVFNPRNAVSTPGAFFRVAGPESVANNLIPMNSDLSAIGLTYTEVAELKVEFESVTVPKVVKGMIDAKVGGTTATEIAQAQNNSSGRMNIDAERIDQCLLTPMFLLMYANLTQKIESDPEIRLEFARVTQPSGQMVEDPQTGAAIWQQFMPEEILQKLPQPLPMESVDIKLVAYQNFLRKQQQLQAMAQTIPMLIQTPAAKYLDYGKMADSALRLSELPENLMMDEAQQKQADESEQQAQQQAQQMQVAEVQGKLQLEQQKLQQDYEIAMAKIELERMKLQMDMQMRLYAEQQRDSEDQSAQDTRTE